MRTFDQSASSSSASTSGSEVIEPCPISVAADMMVIVPSGAIESHGLSALPTRSLACAAACAPLRGSASAKVKPAAPTIICLRVIFLRDLRVLEADVSRIVMAQPSRAARSTAPTMR
jgi:hypothetical protein